MRYLFIMSLAVAVFSISLTATPTLAARGSCSEWREECELDCGLSGSCNQSCREAHKACMSTGCWDTPMSEKVCGVSRE
jgi:hypothetical protein